MNDYVIVDTETTGLSPRTNRVIEIGALRVEKGRVVDEFQILVKTVFVVPYVITQITGITTKMLRDDGVKPISGFSDFRKFLGDLPFVAHNAGFDYNFLNAEMERYELESIRNEKICTCQLSRKTMPFLPNHKLTTIKEHLKLDLQSHRALTDAYVCYEIMKAKE